MQIAAHERFLQKRNFAYWVGRVRYWDTHERDRQRWELLDCGRRLREEKDPRAGFISINDEGSDVMTVRLLSPLRPQAG